MSAIRELLHHLVDALPEEELEEAHQLLDALRAANDVGADAVTPDGKRYPRTLRLIGTGHTDYTDVSSDKYKHLAEIYADNHEDG
jgi:hypothetical protein